MKAIPHGWSTAEGALLDIVPENDAEREWLTNAIKTVAFKTKRKDFIGFVDVIATDGPSTDAEDRYNTDINELRDMKENKEETDTMLVQEIGLYFGR